LRPVLAGTDRYANNPGPWREWDDEIIAIRTDGGPTTVWRFAHHRSDVNCVNAVPACTEDKDPFWYTPRPNISPDGRWAIFTSNWERSLGIDCCTSAETTPNRRQDVFVVQLR
jgi:hypothetical protein